MAVFCLIALGCATRHTGATDADYLARRRRYTQSLTQREKTGEQVRPADLLALHELEQHLRSLIGPVRIAGVADTGRINLVTLLPGDENSDLADGLLFRSADSSIRVLVTTRGLFSGWLADRFDEKTGAPRDPALALTQPKVYNVIFESDAAVEKYADIPVTVSDGRIVRAMLVDRLQDNCPTCTPDTILLSAIAGDRIFVVDAAARDTIPIPQRCADAVMADDRAQKAIDTYESTGRKDTSLLRRAFQAGNDQFANLKTCYGSAVQSDPRFNRVVDQARSLLAMLPDR